MLKVKDRIILASLCILSLYGGSCLDASFDRLTPFGLSFIVNILLKSCLLISEISEEEVPEYAVVCFVLWHLCEIFLKLRHACLISFCEPSQSFLLSSFQ